MTRPDPDVCLRNAGATSGFLDRRFEPCHKNPVDINHGESLLTIGKNERRGLHSRGINTDGPDMGLGAPVHLGYAHRWGKCPRARPPAYKPEAAESRGPCSTTSPASGTASSAASASGTAPGTAFPIRRLGDLRHLQESGQDARDAVRHGRVSIGPDALTCLRFGINQTPVTNAILADPRSLPELLGTARRPHRGETNPQGQMSPTARAAREPAPSARPEAAPASCRGQGIRKDLRSAPGPSQSTVTQAGGDSCRLRARTSPKRLA